MRVLVHATATALGAAERRPLAALAGLSVLLWVLAAFLFAAPGASVAENFGTDLMVFLDGIHRLEAGQRPSLEFETPLGVLAYVMPYLGYKIVGGFGGALETAGVLMLGPFLAASTIMLAPRTQPTLAAVFLVALTAIVAVPVTPGGWGTEVSTAMHYNRWGWGALAIILLAGIPPRPGAYSYPALETGLIATLLIALFFLKMTYAAAAAGLLLLALALPDLRWRVGMALVLAAAALVLIALAGPYMLEYFSDLLDALAASGPVRRTLGPEFIRNLPALALVALGFGRAYVLGRADARAIGFALAVAAAGSAILNQNNERSFIFLLLVPFLYLDRLLETADNVLDRALPTVLAGLFLLPQLISWGLATMLFYAAMFDPAKELTSPRLANVYFGERWANIFDMELETMPAHEVLIAARSIKPRHRLMQGEYARIIDDGIAFVSGEGVTQPIQVLDFVDPVSAGAGLPPPENGYSWIHPHRNISEATAMTPERFFAGIDHVLEPIYPVAPGSHRVIQQIYGAYLASNFQPIAESRFWRLLARRPTGD